MCKQPHHRKTREKTSREKQKEKRCKLIKQHIEKMSMDDPESADDINLQNGHTEQHFHMDFGFVRGAGFRIKQEDKPTITSIDGFNSYLIIVDRVTRYIWVFLTTSSSEQP